MFVAFVLQAVYQPYVNRVEARLETLSLGATLVTLLLGQALLLSDLVPPDMALGDEGKAALRLGAGLMNAVVFCIFATALAREFFGSRLGCGSNAAALELAAATASQHGQESVVGATPPRPGPKHSRGEGSSVPQTTLVHTNSGRLSAINPMLDEKTVARMRASSEEQGQGQGQPNFGAVSPPSQKQKLLATATVTPSAALERESRL